MSSGVTMAKSTSNSNKDERPANERRRISDKAAADKTKGMDVPDYARHENRFVHSLHALWTGYIFTIYPEKCLGTVSNSESFLFYLRT